MQYFWGYQLDQSSRLWAAQVWARHIWLNNLRPKPRWKWFIFIDAEKKLVCNVTIDESSNVRQTRQSTKNTINTKVAVMGYNGGGGDNGGGGGIK